MGMSSGVGGAAVPHWHWASAAPEPAARDATAGDASVVGDRGAWIYGVALGAQYDPHAAAHDPAFRRMYMHAALQRSYDFSASCRLAASEDAALHVQREQPSPAGALRKSCASAPRARPS
jgi:hypothetical protein